MNLRQETRAHSRQQRCGMTYLEVSISSLLVGLLFVGALRGLASATRAGLRSQQRVQAAQLARGLQAEICGLPYQAPNETPAFGTEASESSGTTRADFDDVDDFHNWAETPPVTSSGVTIPHITNWQRTVTVAYANPNNLPQTSATDEGVKRVTVRVSQVSPPLLLSESVGYQYQRSSQLLQQPHAVTEHFQGNRSPVARITASTLVGTTSVTVNFQSTGSLDPDGDAISFAWDFGDGAASSSPNPTHTFANSTSADRAFAVQLTVTDDLGAFTVAHKTVVVTAN